MIDALSGAYLEALEEAFRQNPQSISSEWQHYLASQPQTNGPCGKPLSLGTDGGYVQLDPLGLAQSHWFRLYTQSTALEVDHITDPMRRTWLEERFQTPLTSPLMSLREVQHALYSAHAFEMFLHRKYPGAKRFGLDGGEMLLVALEVLAKHSAQRHIRDIIVGMAHRGRLCVLANWFRQPLEQIFQQFEGHPLYRLGDDYGSGDVKYHAGYSSDREVLGHPLHFSLVPNPSHLEAVTPVVLGKTRAKQIRKGRDAVLSVIMHGDAAFSGQGVVMESLQLAKLPGYHTGGTVHIVIDNQIGFTTAPCEGRSTLFPTDIAKMMEIPVWHIQGDGDVSAMLHAIESALDYRATFESDVIIHWVCYRRYGHNEGDEPAYTQPTMYRTIAERPLMAIEIDADIRQEVDNKLDAAWQAVQQNTIHSEPDWLQGDWSGIQLTPSQAQPAITGITAQVFAQVGAAMHALPSGFAMHPKLAKWFATRQQNMERGIHIDWSTAEAIAFGSLLLENHPVRLTGQDVSRGTFTQRHAALFDCQTGTKWVGLQSLGTFDLINSPLSEMAALGFEYGYSASAPCSLVLWEAQFGDFVNGAQIIIDQFIASAQTKWLRLSGLVLLLPHGLEGQGPEHSSARLERFMELSANNNWRVVNCTTPANYFHALRRQMKESDRKPLIVMTPKSLLRHKRCVSSWADFDENTRFQPVILDPFVSVEAAARIVLCQGKIYYDLIEQRDAEQAYDVAIVRLEQLYPLPLLNLREDAELVWCQEEPHNMGMWPFLCMQDDALWKRAHYVGRPPSASPATGLSSRHHAEQQALLKAAIKGVLG